MKYLKWSLWIILGILIVVIVGGYCWLRATLPNYKGDLIVKGVTGNVEIIRDSYGMPHIYAGNDNDAYFALGYCMAQDRLFQMDMLRRAIRGRLSEILGKDMVGVDKLFRTITAEKPVDELYKDYPPEIVDAMTAFTAGINYYLDTRKDPLPIEFTLLGYKPEPWQPSDCGAVYYYMSWDLNSSFDIEPLFDLIKQKVGEDAARELFIDYPAGYPTIMSGTEVLSSANTERMLAVMTRAREVLGAEGGGVSNNWVISGKKSETGKPILATDMHLGHSLPGIWYEAHLSTPTMNVSGVIAPGIPFVIVGATDHVAWGFTNTMADDSDYYLEKLNPDNENQYEYKGAWEDMTTRKEVIKVKGSKDVNYTVRLTRHGPVVDDVDRYDAPQGHVLAMRWTAPELDTVPMALYAFNRAATIDDMEKGIAYFKCPGQNIVYADDQGNIGYWASVGIPKREGFSGMDILPGWEGKYEWNGYVPTDQQPHLRNPERGWIASANNKHTGPGFPYPISNYYAMPDRYLRITEMLTEKDKLSVADFERMHADFLVVLAREWVPIFVDHLSDKKLNENEAAALEMLKEWDYVATPESPAPAVFHAMVQTLIKNTLQKRLNKELYVRYLGNGYVVLNALREMIGKGDSVWFDNPDTKDVEDMDAVITKSFKEAVSYLEEARGNNPKRWAWGKLHTLTYHHPFGKSSPILGFFLDRGPYPVGGSISTVNPMPWHLEDPWEVYHGASERCIFDLSNMENSLRVIPAGVSGNFMSPHYDDQIDLWRTVTYRPFVINREGVDADAKYVTTMKPEE
jgi:penicillin G amidase